MLTDDEELFQGTAQEAEDEKERTGISKYAGRKSLIEEPVKGRLFCMKKATETKSVAFVISFFCALCVELKPTKRYSGCKLNPGYLTAPERFCLVLLRSRPDTVHGFLLRETQISTPLVEGSSTENSPKQTITSAIADCRNRVPLPPRLARKLYDLIIFGIFCKMHI